MRLAAVALIDEAVRVAAAGTVKFRPAAAAALFGVQMSFRKVCFDVVVKCSLC